MCGRYVLVQKVDLIEKKFNASFKDEGIPYKPSYNIAPGQFAAVVTYENSYEIRMFKFGLIPFWAKKNISFINARAEGDENKENSIEVHSGKGIINKSAFRKPIRSQRCLVIADCFFEGSDVEKLNKPYLVYLNDRRPFAFAGIWDTWIDKNDNSIINSFAIITTRANKLMQKIGHSRSPVILNPEDEQKWLKTNHLATATAMLEPYSSEKMNAYPISNKIKNYQNNAAEFLQPIGETIFAKQTISTKRTYQLQGMGNAKRIDSRITIEERNKY